MPRAFCLACLAVAALALLPAQAEAQTPVRTIAVVGEDSLRAANDTARVGFALRARGNDRRTAVARSSTKLRRVLSALSAAGIADRDLRTGSVGVARVRDRRGRIVPGRFEARQSVTARVREVKATGSVIKGVVSAGGVPVSGPTYFLADPKALFRRALVLALRDAREKAAQLAAASGLTLGAPISVRESGFVGDDEFLSQDDAGGGEGGGRVRAPRAAPPPTRVGRTTVDAAVFVVFEATQP